ncbi:MAG TPA: phosphoribosyltransferase, partial [Burkholderiales bacterium]|nr:phosphoribosyltransferase [Burkholderiales bacterium]
MAAPFRDRVHAGRELAKMLEEFRGTPALVLAIPAGGVPVARAIATQLGLPLDLAPVSKVLYPWTTESGYGAVAFDGSVWLDESRMSGHNVSAMQAERAVAEARA